MQQLRVQRIQTVWFIQICLFGHHAPTFMVQKKKQILSEELGISILVAVLRSHIPLNHDGQSWKTSCQITTDSPTWKIQKGENSENSTGTIISYDLPWWFIIGSTSFTGSLDPNYSKCLGHTEVRLSRGVGYPGH